VLWNGSPVPGGTIVNAVGSTWVQYSFTVTATGSSTVLEFTGRQDPKENAVTNISVTPGSAPLTPAPRSVVLTGIGPAGLALWSLRRKLVKA